MELRQLEYLVAVVEEANFTRAAERVRISQSGVSAQIRQLEHELGVGLLDRSGRTTTVTTAGAAVLEHARAVLDSVAALRQAADDVNGLVRGRLVVGMVNGCTITPLFTGLAAFHHAHPAVELAVYEDNSDRLLDAVRTGAADLALVGVAQAPPPELAQLPIISEPVVAAVPADHPLADRSAATLAEVCRYPIICLPEGTGIRTAFDLACRQAGVRADVALQASAPAAVAGLAAHGLGVAILSRSMTTSAEHLKPVTLTDATIPAVLAVVWKPSPAPALARLTTHLHTAFTPSPST